MDQQLQSFEQKVQRVNDQDLVEHIGKLLSHEKKIGDAILLGLKEIKHRRIFAAMGFSSLFEMLVKHYHLSETASYQRINALKLIESVPEAQEALFNGEVSLSTAALAQSFIQRSEKEKSSPMSHDEKINIIKSIKGKTNKQAQVIFAEINPIAALPANKEKPLSKNHTQLQIVVDEETMALLKQIKELLSYTIPDGDYNAVLKFMGREVTEILRKKKCCSDIKTTLKNNYDKNSSSNNSQNLDYPTMDLKSKNTYGSASTSTSALASESQSESTVFSGSSFRSNLSKSTTDASKRCMHSRYIDKATKRAVYARAKGQCEFVGLDGHRCESRHRLEIDHLKPWSKGGRNEKKNLRILCKTHNLFRTIYTHGFWYNNHT